MSFSDLGLNATFAATIHAAGYENPTELQKQLIPLITQNQSVIIWTQSASGKTGAFLTPAIDYILSNPLEEHRHARVLILTSRRDRVNQINYTIKRLLGNEQQIRSGFIVSGRPYQPQMRLLRRPLDLMIATPGRLNDLVDNNKADFSKLEMLIIDDLSAIYQKGLHGLINKILSERTSACPAIVFVKKDTEVSNYARAILSGAQELEVEEDKNPLLHLPQVVHLADDYTHKIALMDHLLDEFAGEPTCIFTSTIKTAKALAESLANHGHTAEVASSLSPEECNTDTNPILIYSDQDTAEPILKGHEHIINFELPNKVEAYEARLSCIPNSDTREEAIIAVVLPRERENLQQIENFLGDSIEQCTLPGLAPLEHTSNFTPSIRSPRTQSNNSQQRPNNNNRQRQDRAGGGSNQSRQRNNNSPNNRGRDNNGSNQNRPQSGGNHRQNQDNRRDPNSSNNDGQQRSARKGQYGRGNGGNTNNQNHNRRIDNGNGQQRRSNYVGGFNMNRDNSRGYEIGDWENKPDYSMSAPQDKTADDKKVVIRYKEKRRILTQ